MSSGPLGPMFGFLQTVTRELLIPYDICAAYLLN